MIAQLLSLFLAPAVPGAAADAQAVWTRFERACVAPMARSAMLNPVGFPPVETTAGTGDTGTARHWWLTDTVVLSALSAPSGEQGCRAGLIPRKAAEPATLRYLEEAFADWLHTAPDFAEVRPCAQVEDGVMRLAESTAPGASGRYLKIFVMTHRASGQFHLMAAEAGFAPHDCAPGGQ